MMETSRTTKKLHADFCLDVRPGVIAFQFEVLVVEVENAFYVRINLHDGQGTRLTGQLQTGLVQVVQVEMGVACGVDEVAGFEACHLCHHLQQQGVGGDVERYA